MIVLEERAANGCPITIIIAVNFSELLTQIAFSQSGTNFCTNSIQHVYETLLISRKAIDNVSRTKVSDIFWLLHQATHEAYISSEMFGFIREALLHSNTVHQDSVGEIINGEGRDFKS
ncbi:hypothetical protein ES332_A13G152500v1 [Gossypium tomentosum]|uniref:Uncharacterized protein n=1 Tax=Gossypium tomentosum TaxID=34277 RepID=A0A5D2MMV1_GOSTO|nr:hypothetical protein ES332_A13G152500v1 [Gossypium tomentosum]